MKLFRHYKNKPYKYVGIAKHSESLEDVVVYECRYENALGKLWVRPKDMFFSEIELDGKKVRRFAPIDLRIEETEKITARETALIEPLMKAAFGDWDEASFSSRLRNSSRAYLLLGFVEDRAVAFKIGYETDGGTFYSWLGAVHPDFRDVGIAGDLMKKQHEWAMKQGYLKIQTKTQNRYREMLILNLKSGFEIIGTHASDQGGPKIILEKRLG